MVVKGRKVLDSPHSLVGLHWPTGIKPIRSFIEDECKSSIWYSKVYQDNASVTVRQYYVDPLHLQPGSLNLLKALSLASL